MHVRCRNVKLTNFVFKLGAAIVDVCEEYKYLGVMLNQYLDFQMMANAKYDAASRSLSAIITKMKKMADYPLKRM